MTATARAAINRANATHSTGPVTTDGKQNASLNAFKHGLTGQHMILQGHELEAYRSLTAALNSEFKPATETERQLIQHIIDCHTRLNRIAALDSNILNVALIDNSFPHKAIVSENTPATDSIVAQSRAWEAQCDSLDKLGRYEARISRQLHQYTKELDRVQLLNRPALQSVAAAQSKPMERKPDTTQLASFRTTPLIDQIGLRPGRPESRPARVPAIKSFQQQ